MHYMLHEDRCSPLLVRTRYLTPLSEVSTIRHKSDPLTDISLSIQTHLTTCAAGEVFEPEIIPWLLDSVGFPCNILFAV